MKSNRRNRCFGNQSYRRKNISPEQKEDGNYVNFAICGMLIVFLVIILYFFTSNMQLYLLKNNLKTGIEMAEDYLLSSADKGDNINQTAYKKEKDRMHIIIDADLTNTKTASETAQIKYLAELYAKEIKKTFYLDDNNYPTAGVLSNLQMGEPEALEIQNVTIYEAIYNGDVENTIRKHSTTDIKQFVKYDLSYINNVYQGYTKSILPSNTEVDGKNLKGSTIYSTIKFGISLNQYFEDDPVTVNDLTQTVKMDIVSSNDDDRHNP